jgi:hypothetical protein
MMSQTHTTEVGESNRAHSAPLLLRYSTLISSGLNHPERFVGVGITPESSLRGSTRITRVRQETTDDD